MNRNLKPQPREVGLLPAKFRLRHVNLAARNIDLILVGDRIDFRNHLAPFHAIILVDYKTHEMARHRLRRDVDDMRLDKGILSD